MTYIEIAYKPANKKTIIKKVPFEPNLNVGRAIYLSGLVDMHPEIATLDIGIFKNVVNADHLLSINDRIEIYHPLLICPKEKRRNRAK